MKKTKMKNIGIGVTCSMLGVMALTATVPTLSASSVTSSEDMLAELSRINTEYDDPNDIEAASQDYLDSIQLPETYALDYSGIGNQNTRDMGKAGFTWADEKQEDEFKTAKQTQNSYSDFIAQTDLDKSLITTLTNEVEVNESIMALSLEEATELGLTQSVTWSGGEWVNKEHQGGNDGYDSAQLKVKANGSNNYVTIKNYGLYYNVDTLEYTPVDLKITVNYMDFWSTSNPGANLTVTHKNNNGGMTFSNYYTDEIQMTYETTNSETGDVIDAPIIYQMSDVDMTSSMTFDKNDIIKMTAYAPDTSDASLGDYKDENDKPVGEKGLPVWNYESYYNWVRNDTTNDSIVRFATRYFANATGANKPTRDVNYADASGISDRAEGNFTPSERGWNRLKYYQRDHFITVQDTWGTNSNGDSSGSYEGHSMSTDGNESKFAFIINSNMSFTMNFANALVNYPINSAGSTQTSSMTPYEFDGKAIIDKVSEDANDNGVVEENEAVNYKITLTNTDPLESIKGAPVRDTLLEDLPSYLTLSDVTVTGTQYDLDGNATTYTPSTSGSLTAGTFKIDDLKPMSKVDITYTLTLTGDKPADEDTIENVAVNDDKDPIETCKPGDVSLDCAATVNPIEPDTTITKSMTEDNKDGYVSAGETLHYTLKVTNDDKKYDSYDVSVTDTLLENLPNNVVFNNDVVVDGSTSKGSLTDGTFTLDKVAKDSTVTITYSITTTEDLTPNDTEYISNTACTPYYGDESCDDESEIVNGITDIDKKMVDENGDGVVDAGEKLTYTISVTNPFKNNPANDVHVRDSLLENLPSYLTYNDDMVVEGDSNVYTGSLLDGDFVLDVVNPEKTVTITYSVTAADDLTPLIDGEGEGANYIENIVTDTGKDPDGACDQETSGAVNPGNGSKDCAETIEPVNAPLEISKTAVTPNEDGILRPNDTILFDVHLTNKYDMPAKNAHVRDTLLENTPDWLVDQHDDMIFSETQEVINTIGDLRTADYVIEQIDANTEADITYSMILSKIEDVDSRIDAVENTVCENNNAMTDGIDDEFTDTDNIVDTNCDSTVTKVEPDTSISKTLEDGNGDGIIQDGEILNYQITVVNDSNVPATNVMVRDSLIETIANGDAPYLTYNYEDTEVVGNRFDVKTEGELYNADFVIEEIPGKSSVVINYTITAGDVPDNVESIANIATDNGNEPNICKDRPESEDETETGDGQNPGIGDGLANFKPFSKEATTSETDSEVDANNTIRPIGGMETLTPEVDVINYRNEDCDSAELVTEPETTIEKSVTDANENFVLEDGEVLNYEIVVTNDNTLPVTKVAVRDSLLEDTPEYLSLVEDSITVTSKGAKDEIKTTGDLTEGTFTISEVPAKSNVVITYQMQAVEPLPEDLKVIDNIVTDTGAEPDVCVNPDGSDAIDTDRDEETKDETNSEVSSETDSEVSSETNSEVTSEDDGRDLTEITPLALESTVTTSEDSEITNEESEVSSEAVGSNHIDNLTGMGSVTDPINQKDIDCDIATVPVEGETLIDKTLSDASGNNVAEIGEDLNYEITVTNPNTLPVYSTPVRDSLLENLPEYVTLGDIEVTSDAKGGDVATQGDLTEGTFTIDEIAPKGQVQIDYTLTLNEIPEDASGLINIVTDTGLEPDVCEDADKDIDCDQAIIPFETETLIEKEVMDDNNNGLAEINEPLHYTITVENDTDVDITGTIVRDSLLENLPEYLTFDESTLNVEADFDVETEGSLTDGTFTIVNIPANEEVEITYDLVPTGDLTELPVINNIVTDNGEEPTVCEEADNGIDCDDASVAPAIPEEETPVLPNTGV